MRIKILRNKGEISELFFPCLTINGHKKPEQLREGKRNHLSSLHNIFLLCCMTYVWREVNSGSNCNAQNFAVIFQLNMETWCLRKSGFAYFSGKNRSMIQITILIPRNNIAANGPHLVSCLRTQGIDKAYTYYTFTYIWMNQSTNIVF